LIGIDPNSGKKQIKAMNENGKKGRTKITASNRNLMRARGGFGPPFLLQITRNTP
jgi:hypothetical protein